MSLDQPDCIPNPILRADLCADGFCPGLDGGIAQHTFQSHAKRPGVELLDRNGGRSGSKQGHPPCPKGLINCEGDDDVRLPRPQTGSCCTCSAVMDDDFAARE